MPTLPSGRRIEFSLDRFHALLESLDRLQARQVVDNLNDPDDLLFVLDAVHFRLEDDLPYFADYVAAEWATYAADWSTADRQTLQGWLFSVEARQARIEAIDYIKGLYADRPSGLTMYPYIVQDSLPPAGLMAGSMLRQ
jgi:hypothetical protein